MPLVEFRRHLSAKNKGSLRHAVEALNAHLTSSECPTELPPFFQMRELYLRDIREGLSTEQRAISQELRKERLWTSCIGPEAMRATLRMWLGWMDELQEWAGRSKELAAAQVNFVDCLAVYWADELQAPMPNTKGKGRSSDGLSAPHRQKGPFADFVREAAKLIPPEYLRGVRWDYAISECLRHRA